MTQILILLPHFYEEGVKKQIGKIINLLALLQEVWTSLGERTKVIAKVTLNKDVLTSVLLDDDALDWQKLVIFKRF